MTVSGGSRRSKTSTKSHNITRSVSRLVVTLALAVTVLACGDETEMLVTYPGELCWPPAPRACSLANGFPTPMALGCVRLGHGCNLIGACLTIYYRKALKPCTEQLCTAACYADPMAGQAVTISQLQAGKIPRGTRVVLKNLLVESLASGPSLTAKEASGATITLPDVAMLHGGNVYDVMTPGVRFNTVGTVGPMSNDVLERNYVCKAD
jgi:hypothetical protein